MIINTKISVTLALLISSTGFVSAQRVQYDDRQNRAELVNQAARKSADDFMNARFTNIEKNKKIALENLTLVDVIQQRVYQSLTTVDKSIRQGKAVIQATTIVNDIIKYQLETASYAKSDPALLLFAEKAEMNFKLRALDLILYINQTVMIEKSDVLINIGKRDQLLSHVIDELRVLRAFSYTASRQVYWASLDGVFKSLNPWQGYINNDKQKADEILTNFKY